MVYKENETSITECGQDLDEDRLVVGERRIIFLSDSRDKIGKAQRDDVDDCMMEMLAAWLQQQDNVSQNGVPSWSVLKTALEEIGERQLASELT